jgi:hypothetical protein
VVPENRGFFHLFLAHFELYYIFIVGDGRARHVRWIATDVSYRLRYQASWHESGKYKRARAAQSRFFAKKTAKFWASGQSAIFFYRALYDVISKILELHELDVRIEKNSTF